MALNIRLTSLDKALEWAGRQGVSIPDAAVEQIRRNAERQSVAIAALSKLNLTASMRRDLANAIAEGLSFADWQGRVAAGEITPQQLPNGIRATTFRTSLQQAYNAGRWVEIEKNKRERPYLLFSAVNDSRTTEICRQLSGTIRPVDDPWWEQGHSPPCHFNCRSTVVSLTQTEAQRRTGSGTGLNQPTPTARAAPGFGQKPGQRDAEQSLFNRLVEGLLSVPSIIVGAMRRLLDRLRG